MQISLRDAFVTVRARGKHGPREFTHRAVLIRAAELLSRGDLTILEVADSVGYQSPNSSSDAFRKQMRESPHQYRRRFRTS